MSIESKDFFELTNKLCRNRLKHISQKISSDMELKHFLGSVGSDDMIDYYRAEFGEEAAKKENLEKRIVQEFSPARQRGASSYSNTDRTIYYKYSPVLFVRDMYRKSRQGNSTPGWYAGADMVRKISCGNPRLFIQIMHELFDKAKETDLTPKIQHQVLYQFSERICNATKALEAQGPIINSSLLKISEILQEKIHGSYISNYGTTFCFRLSEEGDLSEHEKWIKLAVAHSRLIVDDEVKKNGLTQDTLYMLSNIFAAKYWLPMRKGETVAIKISDLPVLGDDFKIIIYTPSSKKKTPCTQMSIFETLEDNE